MNTARVKRGTGKLGQEVAIGKHRLVSDVDAVSGGEDLGPSPHDFLAAALGSCKAITLRMYTQRKGWPLEDAEIVVELEPESPGGGMAFDCKIRLVGALDEAQRARLLQIADHCPVHKHLSGKITIKSSLI
jgi:putative redox protein